MRAGIILVLVLFASCGSVAIPEENFYRLDLPQVRGVKTRSPDVLRVEGFELASTLSTDRILVAENRVRLRAYEFHRWINSLDLLVKDCVLVGLTRAQAFAEVKGPADGPGETLLLSGRILDFHQVAIAGSWSGKVTLSLRLEVASGHRLLFQEEFSCSVPMAGSTPSAAVLALSQAMSRVLEHFLSRCSEVGVFEGFAKPGK